MAPIFFALSELETVLYRYYYDLNIDIYFTLLRIIRESCTEVGSQH